MKLSDEQIDALLKRTAATHRALSEKASKNCNLNKDFIRSEARRRRAADAAAQAKTGGWLENLSKTFSQWLQPAPKLAVAFCGVALVLGLGWMFFAGGRTSTAPAFTFHAYAANQTTNGDHNSSQVANNILPHDTAPTLSVWNLPDNIDLDLQNSTVHFQEDGVDLRGTITPLPAETADTAAYNFRASGAIGPHATATAKGTLILNRRTGATAIKSKDDVASIKVAANLEVTYALKTTNAVEKVYGP